MRVINECRVDFNYRVSLKSPIITKTIFSNSVSTDIVNNILKIEKFVDKKHASVFEMLTYTIVISNISKFTLNEVYFQDNIPKETKFVRNSVKINGTKKRCISPKEGFYIGTIHFGTSVIVSFRVIIVSKRFCKNIKNYSNIDYDYIYNVEKPPIRISMESNRVHTVVENKVFKQLSIDNILKSCEYIDTIVDTKIMIKIVNTKLSSTPITNSFTDFESSLCKLIIIGSIEYEIFYKSMKKNRFTKLKYDKVKVLNDVFGFSCFMLAPVGIIYGDRDNIKIIVEDVSTNIINKNKLFINTALLLHY